MLARLVVAALVLVLAACSDGDPGRSLAPRPSAPETSATASLPPSPPLPETRAPRPTYDSAVRRLTAAEREAMTGVSWRPGCPVGLDRLRVVTLDHWDFAGEVRRGVLVVRADVADEVAAIFGGLFRAGFPIRRMAPVDQYDGDDFTSIEADNTSAFNCRPATGSSEWSHHAYGLAIDLNPLENPYVLDGRTSHDRSTRFLDRSRQGRGVIVDNGPVVRAFRDAGWHWGGDWSNPVDYQHFSKLPG